MLNYILFSCKKRKYLRYSNDLKNVIPHWSFVRWYTAMHDRANILISPSSLGRLVVLAYLHWRVANATNLNRVGNIGLHRGWFAVSFLCNWKIKQIFCRCFILFFFIIYIIYLSLFLCYSSCLWPFFIIVCILFIFVYRSVLFIIFIPVTCYCPLWFIFLLLFIFFNYY